MSKRSATSDAAFASIVHTLMCHRQGGLSEKFTKKAIETLVKKLKSKPEELDELIQAITLNGSQSTKCATIERTLDGRMQIAGKKIFPPVLYVRIWRWTNVTKIELRQLQCCKFPLEAKMFNVCVNPYHWERVVSPGIDLSHLGQQRREPENEDYNVGDGKLPLITFGGRDLGSPNLLDNPRPNYNVVHGQGFSGSFEGASQMDAGPLNCNLDGWTVSIGYTSEVPVAPCWLTMNLMTLSNAVDAVQRGPGEFVDFETVDERTQEETKERIAFENALMMLSPVDFWCTITYFELDQQVGETFKVRNAYKTFVIDGFAYPGHSDRFSLGPLTNVQRTPASEKARLHIGKGLSLEYRQDGSVWLRLLGEGQADSYCVFVQSYYLDQANQRPPGDAVHKLYRFAPSLKVFDLSSCYLQMTKEFKMAQESALTQATAVASRALVPPVAMSGATSVGADDLRKACTLRLSFMKGWGQDYSRKSIKETPCWLEIQINQALQLLDKVLQEARWNGPRG